MSIRLPEYIDPVRLAENNRLLQGRISLGRMKRLAAILAEKSLTDSVLIGDADAAEVDLQFSKAAGGLATLNGRISATVQMICQRCMQNMLHTINLQVALAVVESNKQAEQLPERYEPLLINQDADSNENVSLTELIEDELILALPTVALHEVKECPAGVKFRTEQSEAEASMMGDGIPGSDAGTNGVSEEVKKPNPFAVLEQLNLKQND